MFDQETNSYTVAARASKGTLLVNVKYFYIQYISEELD
jgi:hypothetical protein